MSVEIEGLEFQVEAKSDKGADGIDKLANSFKNLKSAIKGGTNLNGSIKQIEKLNQALSGLHTDKLESLGKAMESLNKAGNIKIPASVPKRISEIGNAMKSISQSDIDRMESMSRALQGMQGLQNVRVPQVNTGGTGSGTPNPADINTEPASSGRSTSHSGTQTEDVSNTSGADNGMSHADSQLQEVTRSAGMARTALSGVKKVIGEIGGLTGISYVGQQIGSLPHKIGQALGSLRTMYSEFKKSGGILGAFGRTIKAVATNLGSKLAAGMKQVTSSLGNAFTSKVHNATNKTVLSTTLFELEVQEAAAPDDSEIEKDDDYGILIQLIADVQAIKDAEAKRVTAENGRVSAEKSRVSAENSRVNAETTRVNAEYARVKAEQARVSAEKSRVDVESKRVTAEKGRVDAESKRVAAETARVQAETKRQQDTSKAITDCNTATDSALKAAATMMIVNDDTGKTYQGAIKVIGGKPVFEYDEVVTG